MQYTAEYRRRGHTGTGIVVVHSLAALFDILPTRGWQQNDRDWICAHLWDMTATDGQKYYGLFNDLTIVKGEAAMTEYTSL